jgi:formylglycine-generating enzyme required for sulfatase activity
MHGASRIGPTKQARTLARGGVIAGSLLASAMTGSSTAQCAGDIFDDGLVNGGDLGVMLTYWGPTTESPASQRCDLDANGIVDGGDLGVLLANWGACITVPGWATSLEAQPDPSIVTDPAIRAAIIATRLPWRVRDTATGIEMMLVPPGTFAMGCTASTSIPCAESENPVHSVTLTSPLYLGRYEVMQSQWQAKTGSNPSRFQGAAYPLAATHPVEQVGWQDARDFATAAGMRLPTEAEWEFAYRAGTTAAYHGSAGLTAGSDSEAQLSVIGWWYGNAGGRTHPVGQKLGNGFGLHDMSGNVWEWVNDRYSAIYYEESPSVDPTGPGAGPPWVLRGGSWISDAEGVGCRASSRIAWNGGAWNVGFRVARNP